MRVSKCTDQIDHQRANVSPTPTQKRAQTTIASKFTHSNRRRRGTVACSSVARLLDGDLLVMMRVFSVVTFSLVKRYARRAGSNSSKEQLATSPNRENGYSTRSWTRKVTRNGQARTAKVDYDHEREKYLI